MKELLSIGKDAELDFQNGLDAWMSWDDHEVVLFINFVRYYVDDDFDL